METPVQKIIAIVENGYHENKVLWDEWKATILHYEKNIYGKQHYFTPSQTDSNFCARCDKYFTDELHFRG